MNVFIHSFIHTFIHSFIHACIQYLLRTGYPLQYSWASLVAQLVKNPPAMQETQLQSLGWEDPLEKGKAIHYSILDWRIPCTIRGCKESDMGLQRVRHDWVTFTFPFILHLLSFVLFFFFNIKKNECWKQSRYFKQMKNLSKFIAETPLSKQTPGKRSLETNSSCHHVWASLPHPHFPHFFLVPFVLKPTALVV